MQSATQARSHMGAQSRPCITTALRCLNNSTVKECACFLAFIQAVDLCTDTWRPFQGAVSSVQVWAVSDSEMLSASSSETLRPSAMSPLFLIFRWIFMWSRNIFPGGEKSPLFPLTLRSSTSFLFWLSRCSGVLTERERHSLKYGPGKYGPQSPGGMGHFQ